MAVFERWQEFASWTNMGRPHAHAPKAITARSTAVTRPKIHRLTLAFQRLNHAASSSLPAGRRNGT